MSKAAPDTAILPGLEGILSGPPRRTAIGTVGHTGRLVSNGNRKHGASAQAPREVPVYLCSSCGKESSYYDDCPHCESRSCMRFVRYEAD